MTSDNPGDPNNEIVAVSLLTAQELRDYGGELKRLYPVPSDGSFGDLLKALDRAANGTGATVTSLSKWRPR